MRSAGQESIAPQHRVPAPTSRHQLHQLLRYSPALILIAAAIADAGRWADPDLWWHLLIGQGILRTGHLTYTDPYSYSIPGHFWNNGEWLSEIVMAAFYNVLGVFGLKLMKFLCTSATLALVAMAEAETGAATTLQFALLLIVSVTIGPFLQFRPQIFTFLLLSFMLMLLARHNYRGRAQMLWLVVPLMALWANLHGGFVIGVAVMCTYAGTCLLADLIQHRGWRRGLGACIVAIASALATLLTPYGIGSWYEAAKSILSPALHATMLEWKPLPVAMVRQWHESHLTIIFYLALLVLIGALVTSVILTPRDDDWPLLAVAALLIVAAFTAVRNIPLAAIGVLIPLARHTTLCLRRWGKEALVAPGAPATLRGQAIVAAAAVVLLAGTGFFSNTLATTIPYPEKAVAFMHEHLLRGNLLNDVNWGGYLMWHCEPESRLFIDNRYETVFPGDLIIRYMHFISAQPGWQDVLDNYPNDYVLIGVKRPAYALMLRQKNWSLIYRDQDAALFARSGSPATKIPGVPIITTAANDHAFP